MGEALGRLVTLLALCALIERTSDSAGLRLVLGLVVAAAALSLFAP